MEPVRPVVRRGDLKNGISNFVLIRIGNDIWNGVFVRINGETHNLWRAVDHEVEVLESYVTKRLDRMASLKFLRNSMKR